MKVKSFYQWLRIRRLPVMLDQRSANTHTHAFGFRIDFGAAYLTETLMILYAVTQSQNWEDVQADSVKSKLAYDD